jgi:hypothetical protein|tara:strand:+ start:27 stop:443 length:417 start_codon:yes stop_codon:yes gene_type:complete
MTWLSRKSRAARPKNQRVAPAQAAATKKRGKVKKFNILKPLRDSLSGEWLGTWNKRGHLPFFAFLALLFVAYISLVYRYESNERAKRDATRELLDLSNTHKSLLSEFETQLQRSKLDDEMADVGLVQPASPPQILIEQ